MKLSPLLPLLFFASACDTDRSAGGGGVRVLGSMDTGIVRPADGGNNNNRDASAGSGVDPNKFIDELTAAEITAICTFATDQQGGPGMKMCDANTTITVKTQADCEMSYAAPPGAPHCPVMLLDACMTSLGGDACKLLMSAECASYLQCAFGGGPPDAGEEDAAGGPPDAGE